MEERGGWWAVYTRHHHEHGVSEMLQAKGFEVFLATCQERRRWKDRTKVLTVPLFPCYVFVREQSGATLPVVSTPGVHMILTRGAQLAVIPDREVEAIRRAGREAGCLQPCPYLKCGERVRVVQGPLRDVEGILVRRSGELRLVLSVELLGQSASLEVGCSDVIPLRPFESSAHPSPSAAARPLTDLSRPIAAGAL